MENFIEAMRELGWMNDEDQLTLDLGNGSFLALTNKSGKMPTSIKTCRKVVAYIVHNDERVDLGSLDIEAKDLHQLSNGVIVAKRRYQTGLGIVI